MPDSDRVYVWTWLPGATEPVVAGALEPDGRVHRFFYAESYLRRTEAISLYAPELPLRPGWIDPGEGLRLAGALRDGSPDAWGRRVIEARLAVPDNSLREIDYLLASGSNRFGALDFQASADRYLPRAEEAALDELVEAVDLLHAGRELGRVLDEALLHGTSIGGARPKVLVRDQVDGTEWIGKLSAASDVLPVVNAEAAGLELARRAGIDVPDFRLTRSMGRDVLLVKRFDRGHDGTRRHVVSGLTLVGLDEMVARYATYPAMLDVLRGLEAEAGRAGPELFSRIALNIAIGNNDDHARNHAALWDGASLTLAPAYDLAPGARSGETSAQAMAFDYDGRVRESQFAALLANAANFDLSEPAGRARIDRIVATIRANWVEVADAAGLTRDWRDRLWGRQILNPYAFYDY